MFVAAAYETPTEIGYGGYQMVFTNWIGFIAVWIDELIQCL